MKPQRFVIAIISVFSVFQVTSSQQNIRWRGSDGWDINSRYEQLFSITNVQEFEGSVTKIDTVTPMPDMSYGIMLVAKNDFEEQVVHLGPAWYMLFQDINLNIGDQIEIRGCRVSLRGNTFIMPQELRTSDRLLRIRDEEGIPNWVAWRRR